MKPFIINVDKNTSIGKVVGDYGDYQWKNGFYIGSIVGVYIGVCISYAFLYKK